MRAEIGTRGNIGNVAGQVSEGQAVENLGWFFEKENWGTLLYIIGEGRLPGL